MEYVYETRKLDPGETLVIADGVMWVGSNLQADPANPGRFCVVAHLLVPAPAKERGN